MSTPASLGYVMPAEWEEHARCWMAWPCRESLWGDRLDDAREAYAEVARAIAAFERVTMICNSADVAEASLACGGGIEMLSLPIDDSWVRDIGPTFLVNRRPGAGGEPLGGVDWRFNGYGEKYPDHANDAALAEQIIERVGARRFGVPFVLEGGAIHVDGEGTLIATEECLLHPNRNRGLAKEQVEEHLKAMLGVTKVIWLPYGYEDDETDGHVDEVACFVRPGVILAQTTNDPDDGNFERFRENVAALRAATDARGRALQVVTVPQPERQERGDGRRLTLSYVNFCIANGGVVMPSFDAPQDDRAFRTLRELFPGRSVVQVRATDIVQGGGGIHCITLQQPAV